MTNERKLERDDADVLDKDEPKPGNSIVQAAYSAGLFSDRGGKQEPEEAEAG